MKKFLLLLAGCLFAGSTAFAQTDAETETPTVTPGWTITVSYTDPSGIAPQTYEMTATEYTVSKAQTPVNYAVVDFDVFPEKNKGTKANCVITYTAEDGTTYESGNTPFVQRSIADGGVKVVYAAWLNEKNQVAYVGSNQDYLIGDANWTGVGFVPALLNGQTQQEMYFNSTTVSYKGLYTISTTTYDYNRLQGSGSGAININGTNSWALSSLNKATVDYSTATISFETVNAIKLDIQEVLPFVSPISVEIPEGVSVFIYDDYENEILTVKDYEGEFIPANTPVILKVNSNGSYTFNFVTGASFVYNTETVEDKYVYIPDTKYEESGFYGVHTPHYVPTNGYIFDGENFVPATTSNVITALNCYFLPSDTPESISIAFPKEVNPKAGYYLGGDLTAQYNDEPNPSYKFEESDGTFTLEVASIPASTTFYVIYCDEDGNLSYYGSESKADTDWDSTITPELELKEGDLNIEEGEDGAVNSIGLGSAEGTPAGYLNVTFTLTLDGTTPKTLSYSGTLDTDIKGIVVTVGNDKTNQSGSVDNSTNEIKLETLNDEALIYVYSQEQIYYAIVENQGEVAPQAENDPSNEDYTKASYNSAYEAYSIALTTNTSGSLYLKTEGTEPVSYTYTVTRTIPTAVEGIHAEQEDGVIYNVFGQKVDETYKGIVIRNGKKYIQR